MFLSVDRTLFGRFCDVSAWLGRVAGHLSSSRAVVAENLRLIAKAGGRSATPGDVFESYGRYWGELLAVAARPERIKRLHVEVRGLEYLIDARAKGSVCVLTAHLGNWELLASWLAPELPRGACMVERLKPAYLFALIERIRNSLGFPGIPAEGGGRELFRHLRKGGNVGMVADRVIGAGWRGASILGGHRRIPSAGMDLARRAGATLLPIFIRRDGIGFVIQVHPPLPEHEDPVAAFARMLESELMAAPEQWCVLYPLHDAVADVQPALAARKAVAS